MNTQGTRSYPVSRSVPDWSRVRRILIVKLRSIGDTVLATPSLIALRRHAPQAEIDIVLEDWVAPLLDGFDPAVTVIPVERSTAARLRTALSLRSRRYDVAFNLHGGTTATFLTRISGARYRFGNASYQYARLHNQLLSSPADFWGRDKMHSAEQQLALIGYAGVPVDDRPKTRLTVTEPAMRSVEKRLGGKGAGAGRLALVHPGTAFVTKQWAVDKYAEVLADLARRGLNPVAVGSPAEAAILADLKSRSTVPVTTLADLTLPEVTAIASAADIFIGNDSGIAHIAAAVGTPSVVVFGSSNRVHWRPWTDAPYEIVYEPFECQPCAGYRCEMFGEPRCIQSVAVDNVIAAIEHVLTIGKRRDARPLRS